MFLVTFHQQMAKMHWVIDRVPWLPSKSCYISLKFFETLKDSQVFRFVALDILKILEVLFVLFVPLLWYLVWVPKPLVSEGLKAEMFNPPCTKVFGTHTFYENGRLYSFQLWQAIRTMYKREKTGRVDDPNLVRFPWRLIYVRVFSTKFCQKWLKMTILRHFSDFSPLPPNILRTIRFFLTFLRFLIYPT